ncbi:hypothetical protein AKJ09_03166 [Labilithrix luteola]|uniref:Uncharacterized protein n=1 Tax=Labilithrix luteola TaxID=1391654 RepID=A0A0K1PSK5_9BACT|nr:hypothetical protein AKJ09_03166 [Labilithrix luteola]
MRGGSSRDDDGDVAFGTTGADVVDVGVPQAQSPKAIAACHHESRAMSPALSPRGENAPSP